MALTCESCDNQGFLRLYLIKDIGVKAYICDECGTMYFNRSDINHPDPTIGTCYPVWAKQNGLDYGNLTLVPIGDWWLIWFDKETQKYAGRSKLKNFDFEQVELILKPFWGSTMYMVTIVHTVTPEKAAKLARHTDVSFDLNRYAYFIEFEDEYEGHISAETKNYIQLFADGRTKEAWHQFKLD